MDFLMEYRFETLVSLKKILNCKEWRERENVCVCVCVCSKIHAETKSWFSIAIGEKKYHIA